MQITPLPEEVNTFNVKFVFFPYAYNASWILDYLSDSSKLKWFLSSIVSHFRYRMFELAAYNKLKNDGWSDVYLWENILTTKK